MVRRAHRLEGGCVGLPGRRGLVRQRLVHIGEKGLHQAVAIEAVDGDQAEIDHDPRHHGHRQASPEGDDRAVGAFVPAQPGRPADGEGQQQDAVEQAGGADRGDPPARDRPSGPLRPLRARLHGSCERREAAENADEGEGGAGHPSVQLAHHEGWRAQQQERYGNPQRPAHPALEVTARAVALARPASTPAVACRLGRVGTVGGHQIDGEGDDARAQQAGRGHEHHAERGIRS